VLEHRGGLLRVFAPPAVALPCDGSRLRLLVAPMRLPKSLRRAYASSSLGRWPRDVVYERIHRRRRMLRDVVAYFRAALAAFGGEVSDSGAEDDDEGRAVGADPDDKCVGVLHVFCNSRQPLFLYAEARGTLFGAIETSWGLPSRLPSNERPQSPPQPSSTRVVNVSAPTERGLLRFLLDAVDAILAALGLERLIAQEPAARFLVAWRVIADQVPAVVVAKAYRLSLQGGEDEVDFAALGRDPVVTGTATYDTASEAFVFS
jgi:hypothetical protein